MTEVVLDASALLAVIHGEPGAALAAAQAFEIKIAPASADVASAAGVLHAKTRGRGVSLGDRFCLVLAQETGLPVLTADRAWAGLGLPLDIRLIR